MNLFIENKFCGGSFLSTYGLNEFPKSVLDHRVLNS